MDPAIIISITRVGILVVIGIWNIRIYRDNRSRANF